MTRQTIDEDDSLMRMQVDRALAPLPQDVVAQYLAVLGMVPMDPSLAALRKLLAAHVTHIPFENISKLYYRKRFGLVDLPDKVQKSKIVAG